MSDDSDTVAAAIRIAAAGSANIGSDDSSDGSDPVVADTEVAFINKRGVDVADQGDGGRKSKSPKVVDDDTKFPKIEELVTNDKYKNVSSECNAMILLI